MEPLDPRLLVVNGVGRLCYDLAESTILKHVLLGLVGEQLKQHREPRRGQVEFPEIDMEPLLLLSSLSASSCICRVVNGTAQRPMRWLSVMSFAGADVPPPLSSGITYYVVHFSR